MKTITIANNNLMIRVKEMETPDKSALFAAANAYVQAKRTCGDTQKTYNALLAMVRTLEKKYDFCAIEEGIDVTALLDAFAAAVEKGTAMVMGATTYTCQFKSVEETNLWLAKQKDILIKKMSMNASGAGNQIHSITFEYVVAEDDKQKTDQVTELKKVRLYFQSKMEKVRAQWQQKNPQYTYVTSVKKHWWYSLVGGSVGYFRILNEKYLILYTLNNQ